MSKVKNLIHIVFATKHRELTIPSAHKRDLYGFMFGVLKSRNCWCYRINGVADHVHLLIDLHPSISLANLVKELKQSSNVWMQHNPDFSDFRGWNDGYFAHSISEEQIRNCVDYIVSQDTHHRQVTLIEESRRMCADIGLEWHPKDWE